MKWHTALLAAMVFSACIEAFSSSPECLSWAESPDHGLTDKDSLKEADDLYRKAVKWIRDADGIAAPQMAEMLYAQAESNISGAIFKLKELSSLYSIDVLKELRACETLQKELHVKTGRAHRLRNY